MKIKENPDMKWMHDDVQAWAAELWNAGELQKVALF